MTARAPDLTSTVASEWLKLWTLPFTYWMLAAAGLMAAGAAAVLSLSSSVTMGQSVVEMSPVQIVEVGTVGADLAAFVVAGLAASAVASEFGSGMMAMTLTATPRRWRIVAAKALLLTALGTVAGPLAVLTSVSVSQLVVIGQGAQPLDLAADPRIMALLLAASLMAPFCAVLAVAFAFITRNTSAAVTALVGVMSLTALIDQLPPVWRAAMLPFAPVSALGSIAGLASPAEPGYLAPLWASAVLAAWAAGLLGAAWFTFARHDV
jgi:ABC-2 type transport system permease protein